MLGIGFGTTQTLVRGRRTASTDPVITLSGTRSVDEGTAANTTIGTASIVHDPGYGTLTWSLTDTAGGRFKIGGSDGVVKTDSTVTNFEDFASHSITIKAVDGVLPDLTRVINILVNNVAPTITSDDTFEAAIGDDGVLYTATATEPGDDPITFSLTGTTDFTIDPDTGEITFVDPDGIAADDYVFTLHASDGTGEDTLEITASVAAAFAPTNTVAPAITGTEEVGSTLTCSTGTWTGTPTITYAYQWFRAVTDGGEIVTSGGLMVGIEIDGETSSTYDLVAEDEGEFIFCEVTATNGAGSTMAQSNATGAITSGVVATTWNPSDKDAAITLSNGNLTMTSSSGTYAAVRAVVGASSGKKYWELTVNVLAGSGSTTVHGIANESYDINGAQYLGATADVMGWAGDGAVYTNNGSVGTIQGWAQGDVLGFALDMDNDKIWFRTNGGNWNNSGAADPATNTGGISISGITGTIHAAAQGKTATDQVTANFGGTAYANTAPSGFGNW